MNAIGIVAEYNPFHDGHRYQIETSVRQSLADVVVVAMSGNFVQRGEPAIIDKWKRAEMALRSGADLVIEIPTYFCLSNARTYANAGVELLKGLGGISVISFGSESGNVDAIRTAGLLLDEKAEEINREIKTMTISGYSYPRARQAVLEKMNASSEIIEVISNPNDTLGMEYLRSWGDKPAICVKRNDASATKIRESILDGSYREGMLPKMIEDILFDTFSPGNFSKMLRERNERIFELARFAILREDASIIENMPQAGEGLAFKLKKAAYKANNLDELIEFTKSKRYTYTRISRLIYQILLNITRIDKTNLEHIRILGFTENGREFLSKLKKEELNSLPFVTNLNKYYRKSEFRLDIKATELFNMINGYDLEKFHELKRNPILI